MNEPENFDLSPDSYLDRITEELTRPKSIRELQQAIDRFNTELPRPKIEKLILSEPIRVTDSERPYPNGGSPGVYVFFDEDLRVLYVGKATLTNNLGHRLGTHYFYGDGRPKCPKAEGVSFLATIPVPAEQSFEAAALEEYLIIMLAPPRNAQGKGGAIRVINRRMSEQRRSEQPELNDE